MVFLWSCFPSNISGRIHRQTGLFLPNIQNPVTSQSSLLPLGPVQLLSLPGWCSRFLTGLLAQPHAPSAKAILTQTPLTVSHFAQSQKPIHGTASDPHSGTPAPRSRSDLPPAPPHVPTLPRLAGPSAGPKYARRAPASECFHDLCLEHSSLDIKALLSHFFQSPEQVSPYQRSLPDGAVENGSLRTLEAAVAFLLYFICMHSI